MLILHEVPAPYSVAMFAIGKPALSCWGLVARAGDPTELLTELANGDSLGYLHGASQRRLAWLISRSSGLGDPLTPLLLGAGEVTVPRCRRYCRHTSSPVLRHLGAFPPLWRGPRGIVFVPGRLTWSGGVLPLSPGP